MDSKNSLVTGQFRTLRRTFTGRVSRRALVSGDCAKRWFPRFRRPAPAPPMGRNSWAGSGGHDPADPWRGAGGEPARRRPV